ncbi:CapA family protein [Mongoliitalea daihaiensis]|uniref:CapA family protein n=1 Tax=Mongoliitalea daihaiensis TaxID=2782006 RepID=UPI001F38122A|nr:CapA family protein [Mongoliitalea daihaiensis]UJP64460.1 CapA family protein [Mongoliitalea daihaiensis]
MKILVVGDFYPNFELKNQLLNNEPSKIFCKFLDIIQKSDLAVVNLESPLTTHNKAINKTGPALKSDKVFADFLKNSGFGLATLANNHIMDYGPKGLQDTIEALANVGLAYVGAANSLSVAEQPYIYTSKEGERLAILNFAENEWSTTKGDYPGAAGFDTVSNFYSIQKAKKNADFVLLITHGGHENYNLPSKSFRDLLRFYVDAGADAIVNHHPHCISGFESYNGKPIYYSVGNFLFDKKGSELTYWNKGIAVEIDFSENKINSNTHIFYQSANGNTFELQEGEVADKELNQLDKLSRIIQSDKDLESEFQAWTAKSGKYYSINIEPHSNKVLQALQNRNLLPSLWSKRKKLFLLNMLKCESHRELLISIIENEDSNPQ